LLIGDSLIHFQTEQTTLTLYASSSMGYWMEQSKSWLELPIIELSSQRKCRTDCCWTHMAMVGSYLLFKTHRIHPLPKKWDDGVSCISH
jgi:hypothetical protein